MCTIISLQQKNVYIKNKTTAEIEYSFSTLINEYSPGSNV